VSRLIKSNDNDGFLANEMKKKKKKKKIKKEKK